MQVPVLETASECVGIVYSGNTVKASGKKQYVYTPKKHGYIFDSLLIGNFIPSPTPVVKRECFSDLGGFDESLTSLDDYDMWLRLSQEYNIEYVKAPLATTHQGHNRMSDATMDIFNAEKEILDKYRKHYEDNPDALAERMLKLGILAERLEKYAEAREYYLKSLKKRNINISAILRLFFLILPDLLSKPLSKAHNRVLQSGGPP